LFQVVISDLSLSDLEGVTEGDKTILIRAFGIKIPHTVVRDAESVVVVAVNGRVLDNYTASLDDSAVAVTVLLSDFAGVTLPSCQGAAAGDARTITLSIFSPNTAGGGGGLQAREGKEHMARKLAAVSEAKTMMADPQV
jgi:hypothetical protein